MAQPQVHVNRHGSVNIRSHGGFVGAARPSASTGGMQTSLDEMRAIFSRASATAAPAAAAEQTSSSSSTTTTTSSSTQLAVVASRTLAVVAPHVALSAARRTNATHSEELQRQLTAQQEKNDALTDQLLELEGHRVALLREKQENQTKLRQTLYVCEQKTAEASELSRRLELLRVAAAQQEDESKRASDAATRLEWELKGMRTVQAEATQREEKMARERVEMVAALDRCQRENATLRGELDATRDSSTALEAELKEQLLNATEELGRLRAEREPLLESERAKTTALAHTRTLLDDTQRVVAAERRRVAELQDAMRADEIATRDAKVRLASLQTEVVQLRAGDAILREDAKAARAQADELAKAQRANQQRTDVLRRAVRTLEVANVRAAADLEAARAALAKANEARSADRRTFESDLAGFQAEAERATATFRAVEADNTAQRAAQTEEYARQQRATHERMEAARAKLAETLDELEAARSLGEAAEAARLLERAAASAEQGRLTEALAAVKLAANERESDLKREITTKVSEIDALRREATASAEAHVVKTNALIKVAHELRTDYSESRGEYVPKSIVFLSFCLYPKI